RPWRRNRRPPGTARTGTSTSARASTGIGRTLGSTDSCQPEAALGTKRLVLRTELRWKTRTTEWMVPVRWMKTVAADQAITFKGKYGNQNPVAKLRDALTRETVLERLGITEEALDEGWAS